MLTRLYRIFYISAFVLPVIFLASCSSTKNTTNGPGNSPRKQLTSEQQNEVKAYYYDASKQKMLGNYEQAIAIFKQCLSVDPTNAAAYYEIGNMLEDGKMYDSAMSYAKRAVRFEGGNVWYQDLYAECLQDKGMYKEAINVYASLTKNHPSVVDYYFKLAVVQLQADEFEQAAETYTAIEQRNNGFNEELIRDKIKIYEHAKDYPNAEMEVQRLIKHDSTQVQYYNMLGDIY